MFDYPQLRLETIDGIFHYVCPYCVYNEFIQTVIDNNAVAYVANNAGQFVESCDFIASWEAVSRGPLRCCKCDRAVCGPDGPEEQ